MWRLTCAALLLAAATAVGAAGTSAGHQPAAPPFAGVLDEHRVIQYAQRPVRDRVSLLNRALEQGTASLAFQQEDGYLRSVLSALGIAPESQLLVFSKTGVQRAAIGPG